MLLIISIYVGRMHPTNEYGYNSDRVDTKTPTTKIKHTYYVNAVLYVHCAAPQPQSPSSVCALVNSIGNKKP